MKLFKRIIITIFIFLVLIYTGLSIFIGTKGKSLLSERLSQLIGKQVEVASLHFIPPYTISINGLEIKSLLSIDTMILEPSIAGLFLGKVGLNKLTILRPEVSVVRTKDAEFNINEIVESVRQGQSGESKGSNFFVKKVVIEDGKIFFRDIATKLSFNIQSISLLVNTDLPSFRTTINLDARAITKDNTTDLGIIKASGWLNFLKKDMDVEFSISEVDLAYFTQHYGGLFKKVKSGNLLFNADMVSKSNDLLIDCHIETQDIKFTEESVSYDEDSGIVSLDNLSGMILNSLIGPGSSGIFDFSIRTKLDSPKLEGLRFKGNIFKIPLKVFSSATEETVDKFKKIGEDFEAVGKEIKEQFKDQFKEVKNIFKGFKLKVEEENEAEPTDSQ